MSAPSALASSSGVPETPEHINWLKILHGFYPGAVREETFAKSTHQALEALGFRNENTLACVSVCRDEMCLPFVDLIDHKWKSPFVCITDDVGSERTVFTHTFVLSSLAGLLLLGRTGVGAAISHAIKAVDGRQRFIFYTLPHIGISREGILGEVERPGFSQLSHACGALVKIHSELKKGPLNLQLDPDDIEYSYLKEKLAKKLPPGGGLPSLKDLTDLTHQIIVEDLERLISLVVDREHADYAVITGVMVHAPNGRSYISPGKVYSVVQGKEEPLNYKAFVHHHHSHHHH